MQIMGSHTNVQRNCMKYRNMTSNWLQLMAEGGDAGASGDNGQDAAGDDAAEAAEEVDLDAEFDGLTKKDGKYREAYGKKLQKAIQERTKVLRGQVERLNSLGPALDILAAKYGTTADDPNLAKLIAEDKSLLEDRAMRNGNTPETEAALVRAQAGQRKAEEAIMRLLADQDAKAWEQQAKELEQKFPDANVREALGNQQFRALMQAPYNLDFKKAYMVMYGDDLIEQAVKKERKRVTDTVAAGAKRPRENGMGNQQGAAVGIDPMTMSKEQYKEYVKRIERGERVSFSSK